MAAIDRDIQFIDRGESVPSEVNFSLTLSDDAMAPFFPRGSTVYVDATRPPDEFQAGIFYLRGQILCRQWCEDMTGTLYLLPANPGLGSRCISVSRKEREDCLCLGAVVCDMTLPEPIYGQFTE